MWTYVKIIRWMNGNISHVLPSMRYIMKFAKRGLREEGNSRGALLTTIFWDRTHVATAVIYRHPTIIISVDKRHWNMHLQQNVTIIKYRIRAKWWSCQNPFVSCKNLSVVRQIWPNQWKPNGADFSPNFAALSIIVSSHPIVKKVLEIEIYRTWDIMKITHYMEVF